MASFTASTRVPTRPLSYDYKDMAYRKELMIDYTNGLVYVVDENGNIIDVSEKVYEKLVQEGDINTGDNITIIVPNPSNPDETIHITLQQSITNILKEIDIIKGNIEEINKAIEDLKQNGIGPNGIDADKIVTDATHQFVTQVQLENLKTKVSVTEKIVSIDPANVSGSSAPYVCTVAVAGVHPNYTTLLDISYTNDLFATNEEEEDAFYTIQRCKITTANEATIYFREKPKIKFNVRFAIFTPGID